MHKWIFQKFCFSSNFLVKKNDYEILRIYGKDYINLLHNITTSDVKRFIEEEDKISMPAMILEPKGRIISDLTLNKP